ncbi:MAG TPA: hypothetical protein PK286_13500 [Devosia sp.]|nr:hypothetical protein [Devosia sp.]
MDTDTTDDRIATEPATDVAPEPAADVEAALLHYELVSEVLFVSADGEAAATPLAAEDEAALEDGIALLFEELVQSDMVYVEAPEAEPLAEEAPDPTFALLDELNRIWAQPIAA